MTGTMTPDYVSKSLKKKMEPGEILKFHYDMEGSRWRFAIVHENFGPYSYAMTGRRLKTHDTWQRRYRTLDAAFLHVVNHLNEREDAANAYESIGEWCAEENAKKN